MKDNHFDVMPDSFLYKGAHVRRFVSKLRTKVSGPSGEILYFVKVGTVDKHRWRALVAWRPEDAEHTDQFVDVGLLRLENTPPPPRKEPEPEEEDPDAERTHCPGDPNDENATCGGELKFDPDMVGDTVGGNTLRGWMVCQKCGLAWLAPKGMATVYDGVWKLAKGGRSVETGNGRIRVDGGSNVEGLMARIVKLPDLELEVAKLRKYRDEIEALVKESETVPTRLSEVLLHDSSFRTLQHRVYEALAQGEDGIGSVEHGRETLAKAGFEDVDSHEMTCAIQYTLKYGRMP